MNIAVVGSREGFNEAQVHSQLLKYFEEREMTWWSDIVLISGGARGVDTHAHTFAQEFNMQEIIIRPINPANKMDYLYRNIEIITRADEIIAFWDCKSRGTKFVIEYAMKRNKKVKVITNG